MSLPSTSGDLDQDDVSDPLSDPEERRVLYATLDSFRQYRQAAHYNITHLRRQAFYSLPSAHIDILCEPPFSLPNTFQAVDDAIDSNANIAEAILEVALPSFGVSEQDESWKGQATPSDMDKARSTIRQIYRDWSTGGEHERSASFLAIFAALENHLPPVPIAQRHRYKVLVPGAGLGRLVFELVMAGYTAEGNEISYHQLMASNYILNYARTRGKHKIYPWALSFSNHTSRANQLRSFSIPDVDVATWLDASDAEHLMEVHHGERMSMTAGDFCEVYRQAEYKSAFHAVITCFFIDTAPNVISYIETIRHCLAPGGIWMNSGPLLWHFESAPTPAEREKHRLNAASQHDSDSYPTPSLNVKNEGIGEPGAFELSNDEVLALIQHFGFELVERKDARATGYIQDPESMLQNVYRPAFWVARNGVGSEM